MPVSKIQEIKITKDKFREYVRVQSSGMFNMFDPNARAMTYLTKDEWLYIMKHYEKCMNDFPDVRKEFGLDD